MLVPRAALHIDSHVRLWVAVACMTMCFRHVAVPCAACSAWLLLEQQARTHGCVLLPLPADAEIAVKWKSFALDCRGKGDATCRQASQNCFLDQRKMQNLFRQILNIACHMITGGKNAERTSLVNARSKNTVSPSRELILIFTVKC